MPDMLSLAIQPLSSETLSLLSTPLIYFPILRLQHLMCLNVLDILLAPKVEGLSQP